MWAMANDVKCTLLAAGYDLRDCQFFCLSHKSSKEINWQPKIRAISINVPSFGLFSKELKFVRARGIYGYEFMTYAIIEVSTLVVGPFSLRYISAESSSV